MNIKIICAAAAIMSGSALLAACDRSPQAADGATATGDTGVAPTTSSGTAADIANPDTGEPRVAQGPTGGAAGAAAPGVDPTSRMTAESAGGAESARQ